jgi:2-iminobutanoate/2-iminopropanoate deaminase
MSREVIYTENAPRSPVYSQAIKAAGLVFVAGQGPFHPVTGEICGETIQEQTRQCLIDSLRSGQFNVKGRERDIYFG